MLKKIIYAVCFTLVAMLSVNTTVKASHHAGGEITYQYTGTPNQYLVTLHLYRDCLGITFSTSYVICYSSDSCAQSGSFTVNQVGTGNTIPVNACVNSTQCYEEYFFTGTVTLPMACKDWKFSFNGNARNAAITTLVNPGAQSLGLETFLNNVDAPTNNSPTFNNFAVERICINEIHNYNPQIQEIDGDSIAVTFIDAMSGLNFACPYGLAPLAYNAPYSATNPLSSSTGFTLNPVSGIVNFTPNNVEIGVIDLLVSEFRNGALVGYVIRDIQISVEANCNIIYSNIDTNQIQNGINAYCGNTCVIVKLTNPILCNSVVPSDVRVIDANGIPNPVISATPINCINGLAGPESDSIQICLYFPLKIGTTYMYTKVGFDGNTWVNRCFLDIPEYDTVPINVIDTSVYQIVTANVGCTFDHVDVTFSQNFDCSTIASNGTDFTLLDAGGNPVPVTSVTEFCTAGNFPEGNHFYINVAPGTSATGPLVLLAATGSDGNTIANSCGRFFNVGDTLAIINVLNYIPVNLGPDATVCQTNGAPVLNAGISGVSYSWYYNGVLLPITTQTISADSSGTWSVIVGSGSCTGGDTIAINIIQTPVINLGPDVDYCLGGTAPQLDAGSFPGVTYQWYLNTVAIPGATSQTYTPAVTAAGQYSYSVIVTVGSSCTSVDYMNLNIIPDLSINIGQDLTECANNIAPLDAGNLGAGATYQWYLNSVAISGATSQTYTPTQTGTYSVIASNSSTCTGTDTATITILAAPTASLGPDIGICITDPMPTLNANYPGATNYYWYLNGSLVATTQIQTYQPSNPGQGTFTYTVTVDNGIGCTATSSLNITIATQAVITTLAPTYDLCSSSNFPTLDAGNFPGATYTWTDASSTVVSTTQTFTPTTGGTYTVNVSQGTCTGSATTVVTVFATPNPSLPNITICYNQQVPMLDAGALAGATYSWTDQNSNVVSTSQTYTPTQQGQYTVTVTVGNGAGLTCTGTSTSNVIINPAPSPTLPSNITQCADVQAPILDAGVFTSYSWTLNGTTTGGNTQTLTANQSGTYVVTVTDGNTCTANASVVVTINAVPSVNLGDSLKRCTTDPIPLLNAGNPGATYSWSLNGVPLSNSSDTLSALYGNGTYSVSVVDGNGCSKTASVVYSEQVCGIDIPNVFTPNGDAFNQFFVIDNIESYPNNTLVIYNRWGNKVFEANGYNNTWDGKDAAAGIYYYTLKFTSPVTNASETRHGSLTILR